MTCKKVPKEICLTKKECKYAQGTKRAFCRVSKNKTRKRKDIVTSQRMNNIADDIGINTSDFTHDPCKLLTKLSNHLNGNVYKYKNLSRAKKEEFEDIIPSIRKENNKGKYIISGKSLVLEKKIGSGSYGVIYKAKYDGKHIIVKQPKIKKKSSCNDFMIETLIQNDLFCEFRGRFGNGARIPKIEFIAKYTWDGTKQFLLGMEPLDMDGYKFLDKFKKNDMDLVDMMEQISKFTLQLQNEKKFMHKDLHLGNIMCKKNGNDYRWFIIDFGMSSFMNNKRMFHSVKRFPYPDTHSFNPSHDLRMLITSMYGLINKKSYFGKIIDRYLKHLNYVKKKSGKPMFHSAYYQVIDKKDDVCTPENVNELFYQAKTSFKTGDKNEFLSIILPTLIPV